MLDGLKPYPVYKDSGLEWLGDVPSHWMVRRAKVFLREVDERAVTGNEEMLSVSHKTGITPRREKNVTMFLAESNVGHKICSPGDVVVNTMWAWMAALGVSRYTGLVSPSYAVYRPRMASQFLQVYLDELLRIPQYRAEYAVRSTGITDSRLRLYPDVFLRIPLLCPSIDEQAAIVRFLDHADRRIRRYIHAKQRLIKLLEEQKQAIIHRAVTRGLDPNVRLKPSGVEWLGDVPEHWRVMRFKHAAKVDGRLVDPRLPEHREKTLIAPNHIERGGTARLLALESAASQGADSAKYGVRQGQIIYTKIRPYLRKAVLSPVDCLCSADQYPISPRDPRELDARFLLEVMLSAPFTRHVVDRSLRAAMPKVNREALGEAIVWYPERTEQITILDIVASETGVLRAAIEAAHNELSLLNEYRTCIVADVFRGKLDVRAAAAALPDESEDMKPLDDDDDAEEDDETSESDDA